MKTEYALAVCLAYIKEISDNENVYGLGQIISLSDLDALVNENDKSISDTLLTGVDNNQ